MQAGGTGSSVDWKYCVPIWLPFSLGRDASLVLRSDNHHRRMLTVLRHGEYSHLAPLGVFLALIALAAVSY